jgi:hypothetical protein
MVRFCPIASIVAIVLVPFLAVARQRGRVAGVHVGDSNEDARREAFVLPRLGRLTANAVPRYKKSLSFEPLRAPKDRLQKPAVPPLLGSG